MIKISKYKTATYRRIRVWIYVLGIFVIIIILSYYLFSYNKVYTGEMVEHVYIDSILKQDDNVFQSDYDKYDSPLEKGNEKNTPDNFITEKNTTEWKGDCILIIPDISLKKIVYNGVNREKHLEQYKLVTATDNMKYQNGGNYIICGHASNLYGHSLNRINEIKRDMILYIKTQDNLDEYIVSDVSYKNMKYTSEYCNQTDEPTITIISCAKYISKESYIIIHAKQR